MVQIIAIRHAQTTVNKHPELKGDARIDPSLTTSGAKQCEYWDLDCDVLIVTPLRRTMQTYLFSHIRPKEIIISPLFREYKDDPMNFLKAEVMKKETLLSFQKRVKKARDWLRAYIEKNPDVQTIVIIGHFEHLKKLSQVVGKKKKDLKNLESFQFTL
jgi:broad specificity phosphatase PhoE